jgi:hypothetical protein
MTSFGRVARRSGAYPDCNDSGYAVLVVVGDIGADAGASECAVIDKSSAGWRPARESLATPIAGPLRTPTRASLVVA